MPTPSYAIVLDTTLWRKGPYVAQIPPHLKKELASFLLAHVPCPSLLTLLSRTLPREAGMQGLPLPFSRGVEVQGNGFYITRAGFQPSLM